MGGVVATSSGEEEWYGIASAMAEALFMQGLLERLHCPVKFDIATMCERTAVLSEPQDSESDPARFDH
eukprot:6475085-Amphidinium_carterae.1